VALFSKFFGKTISEAAAFALGGAMRSPLEPPLVELTNETWGRFVDSGITVPTEPGDAAEIAAERVTDRQWAKDQAKQRGYGGEQMDKLIDAVQNAPDLGTLYSLWRRDEISDAQFIHGLRKARLEDQWDAPLERLKSDRLSPEDVARMIQRGLIPDPGILPVGPPGGTGNVPAFPVFNIDADTEARAHGIDHERLSALTGLVGNPMGPHEAAQAEFRGILTDDDFRRAIAEGNTRNEWADAIREQSRQIPSVTNYVEAFVRGWITEAEMNAGTARHGMTPEDTHTEFLIHGRPLSWHQVFIGLRRGGVYDGPTGGIDPAFLKALRESNIRPEWYSLAWAQRFTYPAAFVLRALVQGGDLTAAEGEQILLFEGWEPTLAKTVTAKWAQGSSAAAKEATASDVLTLYDSGHITQAEAHTELVALGYDAAEATKKIEVLDARRVASAKTAAVGDMHGDFKKGRLDAPAVEKGLAALGLEPWAVAAIVEAWRAYRIAEAAQPPPIVPPPVA
jgi:hypothetical protein